MFGSRAALTDGHNKHPSTDNLYNPLRKALKTDITGLSSDFDEASKSSHISHNIKLHSTLENEELGNNTLIRTKGKLKATHEVWRVAGENNFSIINVNKRIREPITREEIEKIMKNKDKEEIVVYVYESSNENSETEDKEVEEIASNRDTYVSFIQKDSTIIEKEEESTMLRNDIPSNEKESEKTEVQASPYIINSFKRKKSISKPISTTYNMFSAIDEPINNFFTTKTLSSCTCPSNSLIAESINEVSWYDKLSR